MALERNDTIDAVGTEKQTGKVVLTILDSWDWQEVHAHLVALQAKLNAYFEFVESGQLYADYPAATGRHVVIDVVTRFPPDPKATDLLEQASEACRDLSIEIRTRHLPGGSAPN